MDSRVAEQPRESLRNGNASHARRNGLPVRWGPLNETALRCVIPPAVNAVEPSHGHFFAAQMVDALNENALVFGRTSDDA